MLVGNITQCRLLCIHNYKFILVSFWVVAVVLFSSTVHAVAKVRAHPSTFNCVRYHRHRRATHTTWLPVRAIGVLPPCYRLRECAQ